MGVEEGDGNESGKGECWIGAYAAKPSQEGGDLEVKFSHLVVEDGNGRMS